MKIIDLAQKILICYVIAQFIYFHCDVIRQHLVETWFIHFSLCVQPTLIKTWQQVPSCSLFSPPTNPTMATRSLGL